MNYKKYGTKIFDFYDVEFLETIKDSLSTEQLQMLDRQAKESKCTNVWDTDYYAVNDTVTCRYGDGVITDWHLTDIGKINGGYQIKLTDGRLVNLYVTQITRRQVHKTLAQSKQSGYTGSIKTKQTFSLNIPF